MKKLIWNGGYDREDDYFKYIKRKPKNIFIGPENSDIVIEFEDGSYYAFGALDQYLLESPTEDDDPDDITDLKHYTKFNKVG